MHLDVLLNLCIWRHFCHTLQNAILADPEAAPKCHTDTALPEPPRPPTPEADDEEEEEDGDDDDDIPLLQDYMPEGLFQMARKCVKVS